MSNHEHEHCGCGCEHHDHDHKPMDKYMIENNVLILLQLIHQSLEYIL